MTADSRSPFENRAVTFQTCQCRKGADDTVRKTARQTISVAAAAKGGSGHASCTEDHGTAVKYTGHCGGPDGFFCAALCCRHSVLFFRWICRFFASDLPIADAESLVFPAFGAVLDRIHCTVSHNLYAQVPKTILQRPGNRFRLIRAGINIFVTVVYGDTLFLEKTDQILLGEIMNKRKNRFSLTIPCMVAGSVQEKIRQVASAVTGRIDLFADFFVFFKNGNTASCTRSCNSRHAAGCAAADHRDPSAGIFHRNLHSGALCPTGQTCFRLPAVLSVELRHKQPCVQISLL